jgi:hypothetical protein
MIPRLYSMPPNNGRDTMRWSQVGTVDDFVQFTGTVDYGSFNQGYDTILTPLEFTRGIQAERKLLDDDQYNILDARPKGIAASRPRGSCWTMTSTTFSMLDPRESLLQHSARASFTARSGSTAHSRQAVHRRSM